MGSGSPPAFQQVRGGRDVGTADLEMHDLVPRRFEPSGGGEHEVGLLRTERVESSGPVHRRSCRGQTNPGATPRGRMWQIYVGGRPCDLPEWGAGATSRAPEIGRASCRE